MFLAKLYERFMIAANRQMASTIIAAVAFMVNLTLDLVLIPHWGIVGATIATLTAEIVLFITAYAYCHRHIATQSVVSIYASAFGSALLACLMVGVLNTYFNIQIIIALFLGYICYLGSLLFFNFFTRLDLLILKELVNFR
jgi:O-antigen/teichoic acid export membrane protein